MKVLHMKTNCVSKFFTSSVFLSDNQCPKYPNFWLRKVCTISFERPVNYLCDTWHVFPPKYEAWTWTEYQCQGVVWILLMIFTESVNGSKCVSVYLIITRLRNVNLLCFSDSIKGIDFLNCTLKCPALWNWPIKIAISTNCSSALFSSKETPI